MRLGNTITYTGRSLDTETGRYYYRNRYYHAQLGRFVSRDPIGYLSGDANRYGYVSGRCINFLDPLELTELKNRSNLPAGMPACVTQFYNRPCLSNCASG